MARVTYTNPVTGKERVARVDLTAETLTLIDRYHDECKIRHGFDPHRHSAIISALVDEIARRADEDDPIAILFLSAND